VSHGVVCYYDREQSVKCAACLRFQRNCDGTFSIKEFRKVGEQKKQLVSKTRAKRREIVRLRKALAAMESDEAELEATLASLEERSSNMLKREMLALGVMDPLDTAKEVALADPSFVWADMPVTDSIDWEEVWGAVPPGSAQDGPSLAAAEAG
jgi:hypothetical protein